MDRIHCFTCPACAYNACQTDEDIKDGDLLVITNNGDPIYALAGTWPTRLIGPQSCMHEFNDPTQAARDHSTALVYAQTLHQAQIAELMPNIQTCICT